MKQGKREFLKLTTVTEEQICSREDILAGNSKVHNYQ